MKAFLILEDGTVFTGTSIGSTREIISEIVFNTSMTGYLEVLTDPSYAGQAVVMTYPLIGNYGITPDMESARPWPDGYIVRELSRMPSNFRCQGSIQDFLTKHDIPGIAGIDTRALTKILREKGTMNGMITTNENYNLDEILPKLKEYTTGNVVDKVTCSEKNVLKGSGKKVALMDFGAKNNIAKSLNARGCEVTVYPAHTSAEEIKGHINLEIKGNEAIFTRDNEEKETKALHGLYRATLHNMVEGVTKGFEKHLMISGVGVKVTLQGTKLVMNIGFSHPVEVEQPKGITFAVVNATPNLVEIAVKGIDKIEVGQCAATIKAIKKVEPYHGYGIYYKDEVVVRKEGKTAGK